MCIKSNSDQTNVLDLFQRNDQSAGLNSSPQRTIATTRQVSENMWSETRKRHCDSREHLRNLLDKHLKPHH